MKALISVSREIANVLFTAPLGLVNVTTKPEAQEEKPYRHWKDIFYC